MCTYSYKAQNRIVPLFLHLPPLTQNKNPLLSFIPFRASVNTLYILQYTLRIHRCKQYTLKIHRCKQCTLNILMQAVHPEHTLTCPKFTFWIFFSEMPLKNSPIFLTHSATLKKRGKDINIKKSHRFSCPSAMSEGRLITTCHYATEGNLCSNCCSNSSEGRLRLELETCGVFQSGFILRTVAKYRQKDVRMSFWHTI